MKVGVKGLIPVHRWSFKSDKKEFRIGCCNCL